jgi:hypothetical protein
MRTSLQAPGSSIAGSLIADWARSATRQLHELLGDDMVAAYLIGSGALGGFVPTSLCSGRPACAGPETVKSA